MWPLCSDPDVLGLDGDAPLPLDVHGVEVLLAHEPGVDRAGDLEDAVRQRRLAVVDVADDGEVADAAQWRRVHWRWLGGGTVRRSYRPHRGSGRLAGPAPARAQRMRPDLLQLSPHR